MQEHEQAKADLSALIEQHGIRFAIVKEMDSDFSDRGTLRFNFTLSTADNSKTYSGHYSAGSAVPLHAFKGKEFEVPGFPPVRWEHWFTEKSVDATESRQRIRAAYLPRAVDVIGCLLTDANSIEGLDDWADWAEEFGMLVNADAEAARKTRNDFETIQQARRFLRAAFQADYNKAAQEADKL